MFKEERILLKLSILLILALSTTLYFGQQETILATLNLFGLNSNQAIKFVENLFLIEHALFPEQFNIYMGILGYISTLVVFIATRLLIKPKMKRVFIAGISLIILGFIDMIILDISVIGWLAGPMIMIAGFLIYRKSYYYL
ncbi:MAG: hypothetical protein PHQ32_00905 [Firmicutes bacterium]|nr:hypothetical protein [Bacillota bacterium]